MATFEDWVTLRYPLMYTLHFEMQPEAWSFHKSSAEFLSLSIEYHVLCIQTFYSICIPLAIQSYCRLKNMLRADIRPELIKLGNLGIYLMEDHL